MRALLTKTTTFALTISLTAGACLAQTGDTYQGFTGQTPSVQYMQPMYGQAPNTGGNFVSTPHEGFFNGIANGIHAVANLSLSLAQSRILNEQAYAMNRQNRVINTQTFLARQAMKEEARRERLEQKWAWESQMKERQAQRKQELAVAFRLPRSVFNAETGRISWPEIFSRPELANLCDELDGLFEGLAQDGPQHDYLYRDPITDVCRELLVAIRGQRDTFGDDLSNYWDAINLVSRLEFKANNWATESQEMGHRNQPYPSHLASANF